MSLEPTASQTVGPYFGRGLRWLYCSDLAPHGAAGEPVEIRGRVLDGDGQPVVDALLEIWHADVEGRYPHPEDPRGSSVLPGFRGFGRTATDTEGRFRFTTRKPGRVPGPEGTLQAPHLVVNVFMRGLLRQTRTRVYFPDDPANTDDHVLRLVPAVRRDTLVARRFAAGVFEWDVNMQGEAETVFFEY